ncbi:MAG: DNA primase, partial [candidate division NC10 bacterium]|nr:DNA primase [candidate division NC10 bacterium]
MTNFSEETVREILSGTDIVEVISAHLPLRLSGKNYRALCPFHSEKTPSFTVSPDKQIYHCFGCGEGGNALTFLMKVERLSFPEALRHLAERAGIRLPEKGYGKASGSSKLELYEVNRLACEFYAEELRRVPEGEKAQSYLKSRGIGEDTWDQFRLGYAPDSWDRLLRHLRGKGKPFPFLESVGLILPGRQPGSFHDRFRDRLMFPILDSQERILGFGGRAFSDGESKYMNSPTSPIYSKGENLYGLNCASKRIREEGKALIVEGYFDLISMHLFGWTHTVASLGTSLTSGQAHLLRRYTDRALLLFDSDPPGIRASIRSVELLLEQGFSLEVAELPAGHDPDSLLQKEGRAAMEEVLDRSLDWMDFLWELKEEEGRQEGIREEVRKVRAILPLLARMKDRLSGAKYLGRLAERSGLREDLLLQEMKEARRREERSDIPAAPISPSFPAEERQALEVALLHPEKWERWAELLDPSLISDREL